MSIHFLNVFQKVLHFYLIAESPSLRFAGESRMLLDAKFHIRTSLRVAKLVILEFSVELLLITYFEK